MAQTSKDTASIPACITELGLIKVDPCNHTFSFLAQVNMSKGLIEVVISTPSGKNHESIFVTQVDPVTFEAALNLIGCVKTKAYPMFVKKPEEVLKVKHKKSKPDRVEIWVDYRDSLKNTHTARIEDFIWDEFSKHSLSYCYWHFKGIPEDEKGNPIPYSGNNLVVSFIEMDSVLEMDTPMLFDDNYLFANNKNKELFANRNVIIHVKLVKK